MVGCLPADYRRCGVVWFGDGRNGLDSAGADAGVREPVQWPRGKGKKVWGSFELKLKLELPASDRPCPSLPTIHPS